jgi:hypothetical protein
MGKLFLSLFAVGLILGQSNLANAREKITINNQFKLTNPKKTEFNGDSANNCRVKIAKSRERVGTWERDVIYEICLKNNQPVYLVESYDGGENGKVNKIARLLFSYKNGKLVRVDDSITYESIGFRNGQPVAVADIDGVNSNLSEDERKLNLRYLDSLKNILKKFGIR